MTRIPPQKIFLSYGHDKNANLVNMIKASLEKQGHIVWLDKTQEANKGIRFGDDWRNEITKGIKDSDKVLSFLSKHSTREPGVCRDEIALALSVRKAIVKTILLEPETEVMPPANIGHVQWLDMQEWEQKYNKGGKEWNDWYDEKLLEIIGVIESKENIRFAGEIEELQKKLQPVESFAYINSLVEKGFIGREWLFDKLDNWLQDSNKQSQIFVLLATAGVGKSAFAASLAHNRGDVVAATHFCKWNEPTHSNALNTIKTIAFQLAIRLPDYRKKLLGIIDTINLDHIRPK